MRVSFLLIFLLASATLSAQNLIPNGSFEEMKKCPKAIGQIDRVELWNSPNEGTPDYFNACFTRNFNTVGVPNNYFGTMGSFDGAAYAGILCGKKEKEYLQISLMEPLVAGRKYCLRFRAAAPSPKSEARTALRAFFLDEPLAISNWDQLEIEPSALLKGKWRVESQNSTWSLFSTSFEADGTESVLVVGYFELLDYLGYSFLDHFELYESASEEGCGESMFSNEEKDPHNFISNPGYEQMFGCPQKREQLSKAKSWRISLNSPDFFHTCGTGSAAVPDNTLGHQMPNSGNGYGGFWAFLEARQSYREYVSTQLKTPLEAGKMYCLSIRLSLAETSDHALEELQLLVTDAGSSYNELEIKEEDLVTLSNSKMLDNMEDWMFLHGTFTAKGDEQTIMIGNFKSNEAPTLHELEGLPSRKQAYTNCSYYYIDDVGLHELGSPTCPCPGMQVQLATAPTDSATQEEAEWQAGDTLILRNLQFAFNKSDILPQSLPLLDSLSNFLKRNTHLNVQITGHTDSDGGDDYNFRLSQARAEAVSSYLVLQEIAADRINALGRGASSPCAPNDSEAGKALNRRVEVAFE